MKKLIVIVSAMALWPNNAYSSPSEDWEKYDEIRHILEIKEIGESQKAESEENMLEGLKGDVTEWHEKVKEEVTNIENSIPYDGQVFSGSCSLFVTTGVPYIVESLSGQIDTLTYTARSLIDGSPYWYYNNFHVPATYDFGITIPNPLTTSDFGGTTGDSGIMIDETEIDIEHGDSSSPPWLKMLVEGQLCTFTRKDNDGTNSIFVQVGNEYETCFGPVIKDMDGQVNSIPLADGNPNLKAMFGDAIGNIKSEILD
ncbi:MAG: hypothetical protein LBP31_02895, partial [Holosporales bacterium]|nr:hypothetical protein [Holosporales bacterium]